MSAQNYFRIFCAICVTANAIANLKLLSFSASQEVDLSLVLWRGKVVFACHKINNQECLKVVGLAAQSLDYPIIKNKIITGEAQNSKAVAAKIEALKGDLNVAVEDFSGSW